MTLQQIRLVVEAVDRGSISAAAEKLNISQPNASLSIKKLEDELGYSLLRRADGGISPTEQGYRFLEHAQALLDEDRAIRSISSDNRVPRLRIGVMNFTPAIEAFIRFCGEMSSVEGGEFTCINVSFDTGVRLLKERKIDVLVSIQLKKELPLTENTCRENRFLMQKLADIPFCVRVRDGHPLLLEGALDGTPKGFKRLSAYPYVDYLQLESLLGIFNQGAASPFGYSGRIHVDERETRLRIVSETDAYSIGAYASHGRFRSYGLVSIPLGFETVLLGIIRKGDEKLADTARYLELLREEIPEY